MSEELMESIRTISHCIQNINQETKIILKVSNIHSLVEK